MSVFRVEKTKNYTIMSNYHLKEKQMSLKAKGLLSLMLSLPNDWDYSLAGLVNICKENETAIKSALDELKKFGYLEIIKNMPSEDNGGRINYEYIIYEQPIQEHRKQAIENLPLEIQYVENHGQLNTKELNTKELNTNNIEYNSAEEVNSNKTDLILLKENVKCIIDYLNESIDAKFKYTTSETISLIKARLKEGYVLDDFYEVIDKKVKEWINTDMEKYLRPKTLFGNKFESYFNQKDTFRGKPKTSYSSKPSFDNTANHDIKVYHITDDEFNKLTHEEKIDTLLNKIGAVANMTINQKEYYNMYCLARDKNGNLLEF